jgi:heme/copper-type cytochrome/quinol oxidase subunit 4
MKQLKFLGKQVLIIFILSFLLSLAAIIHGIFFDLDFEQIRRLTLTGMIFTLIVVFPVILFLEWVFDMNNRKKFDEIDKRLNKLEKKKK